MTRELVHEQGCDARHAQRQRCNGPVAEALRVGPRPAEPDTETHITLPALPRVTVLHWRIVGAATELSVCLSITIVWLGSRPGSLKYTDFDPLHALALLPPLGWLWRRGSEVGWGIAFWLARMSFIVAAAFMWARANDHQIFKIEDNSFFYHDYCCGRAWTAGMNTAMALAVLVTAFSACLLCTFLWHEWRSRAEPS